MTNRERIKRMNKIIDCRRVALLYLAFPVVIFLFNWYIPLLSVPLSAGILYCIFCFPVAQSQPLSRRMLIVSLIAILVWVYLSGIGGYVFQNADHTYRNAVLRDLVNCEWPVVYSGSEGHTSMLCYYFAYWIPAALVGKVLGLAWAQNFLYIWTVVGIFLFIRVAGSVKGKHVFMLLLFLIFFGGLDLLPFISRNAAEFRPWKHMEWWGEWQYSSLTTCLFWVYNQALPAWICTALVTNPKVTLAQKAFIAALLFAYSPFPFIGIVAYVCADYVVCAFLRYRVQGHVGRWLVSEGKDIFGKRQWVFVCIAFALFGILATFFGCTGRGVSVYILDGFTWKSYLLFCIVEFLIPCVLMLWYKYEARRVGVITFLLLILPLFQLISKTDFVMRVSVPLILMLAVTFFTFMMTPRVQANKRLLMFCIAYVVLGAAVPCSEICRTLKNTYKGQSEPCYIESLPDSPGKLNFTSAEYQESFYFKKLMKRSADSANARDVVK